MGCMQSADFVTQPKNQQKNKKTGKKKKNKNVQPADRDEFAHAAGDVPEPSQRGGMQHEESTHANPFAPPKATSAVDKEASGCGSRSGRRPTAKSTSVPNLPDMSGGGNNAIAPQPPQPAPAVETSQLGSKKGGIAQRVIRANEGGLNATKLGSVRMWIDSGDHVDLVDPQDVFGHERKMRQKRMMRDYAASAGQETNTSSFQENNGLSSHMTSNASRF